MEAGAVGECSGKCPLGKYSDTLGARTEDDCKYCPPGTYGSTEALGNRACTAECPAGRYSLEPGLYAATQCKPWSQHRAPAAIVHVYVCVCVEALRCMA